MIFEVDPIHDHGLPRVAPGQGQLVTPNASLNSILLKTQICLFASSLHKISEQVRLIDKNKFGTAQS